MKTDKKAIYKIIPTAFCDVFGREIFAYRIFEIKTNKRIDIGNGFATRWGAKRYLKKFMKREKHRKDWFKQNPVYLDENGDVVK